MIVTAIFKLIEASTAFTANLAVYKTKPAMFTGGIPDDTKFPAVTINDVTGSGGGGCRSKRGGATVLDVQVFTDKGRSSKTLRGLALDLWKLLDRASLNSYLTGFTECGVQADPPANTNDGFGFPGRTIRVRVTWMEA